MDLKKIINSDMPFSPNSAGSALSRLSDSSLAIGGGAVECAKAALPSEHRPDEMHHHRKLERHCDDDTRSSTGEDEDDDDDDVGGNDDSKRRGEVADNEALQRTSNCDSSCSQPPPPPPPPLLGALSQLGDAAIAVFARTKPLPFGPTLSLPGSLAAPRPPPPAPAPSALSIDHRRAHEHRAAKKDGEEEVSEYANDNQFCRLCLKSFSSRKYRIVHFQTVHRGIRNFNCSVCRQPFGTRSSMRRHLNTVHHKHKPHRCAVCHTAFGTKSSMVRHLRTIHRTS